jgi:hypothetical protein
VQEGALAGRVDERDTRRGRHGRVADHTGAVDAALAEERDDEVAEGVGADLAQDGGAQPEPRQRARGVERTAAAAQDDRVDECESADRRQRVDRARDHVGDEDPEADDVGHGVTDPLIPSAPKCSVVLTAHSTAAGRDAPAAAGIVVGGDEGGEDDAHERVAGARRVDDGGWDAGRVGVRLAAQERAAAAERHDREPAAEHRHGLGRPPGLGLAREEQRLVGVQPHEQRAVARDSCERDCFVAVDPAVRAQVPVEKDVRAGAEREHPRAQRYAPFRSPTSVFDPRRPLPPPQLRPRARTPAPPSSRAPRRRSQIRSRSDSPMQSAGADEPRSGRGSSVSWRSSISTGCRGTS